MGFWNTLTIKYSTGSLFATIVFGICLFVFDTGFLFPAISFVILFIWDIIILMTQSRRNVK